MHDEDARFTSDDHRQYTIQRTTPEAIANARRARTINLRTSARSTVHDARSGRRGDVTRRRAHAVPSASALGMAP
jgi:hypothetical protein